MKKQIPSTFILNADDKKYFFVEGKLSPLYGPVYHVYYDLSDKPALYTANNFVEEHGVNSKIPISEFVQRANADLILLYRSNSTVRETYNTFSMIHKKLEGTSLKKSFIKN